jgi:transposase-like protein
VQGISTRSVDELVKALGMTGIRGARRARLCEGSTGAVRTVLEGDLIE